VGSGTREWADAGSTHQLPAAQAFSVAYGKKIAENSLTSDGPGEKTTENELPFGGTRLTTENNSIFSAVQINCQKYLKPSKKHYVSCSAS
jgi:hypothetical protein